ncbi:hypothetical protein GNI_014580 [Gregarina niphandrodes]|uniref:Uncharacterized protein n=1 Tax=Gregarina niphandrodes TaxID=110365 RepID=A0A023BCA9_GRENI|nr:hypothetical protein GNI_014580 [Gregarina niphandrodes]EZG83568.1 hypothetical protein GNI_014580 [Gregarina niphandrodes]|eukprot:XP_011128929.1 hypothetical protein GNI_014580 [Gregarina niphandrodes]
MSTKGWCSCGGVPLQTLFGGSAADIDDNDTDTVNNSSDASGYDPIKFERRSEEAIAKMINNWNSMLKPRISDLWPTMGENPDLRDVLRQLLTNTDSRDNPLAVEPYCVLWYGDVGIEDGAAVLRVKEGGETRLSYVTRILAYIFASNETFELLLKSDTQGGPLPMSCDNVRCVNLSHCLIPQ